MSKGKVTICILSCNSRHNLPGSLVGVYDQNYPKNLIKVIVVDNNSLDSSVGYVKESYPEVKIISNNSKLGSATLANQALFLAEKNDSEFLVIIKAETILEKNWLNRMVQLLKNKKVGAASSKILMSPENKLIYALGGKIDFAGQGCFLYHKKHNSLKNTNIFESDFAPKEASIYKMETLKKVGFFDNGFHNYFEDMELGWRLRLAGYKIIIDPLAVAYYKPAYADDDDQLFYQENNRAMMIFQNYRIITIILLLPLFIFLEFGFIVGSIAQKGFKQKIKSYLWILAHLAPIISKRIRVQFHLRKVGDLEILK
ncbi:MAG: glycosyltransferase family 2 protein [Candidatus Buchananbacteria bacterium]